MDLSALNTIWPIYQQNSKKSFDNNRSLWSRLTVKNPDPKELSTTTWGDFNGLSSLRQFTLLVEYWSMAKYQIPSTKLQTNLKFQYSMTKTKDRFGPPQADWSL
jgi:hypothetical protein